MPLWYRDPLGEAVTSPTDERPPKGFDSSYNGGNLRNGLSHRVAVRGQTPRRRKTQGNAALARERAREGSPKGYRFAYGG